MLVKTDFGTYEVSARIEQYSNNGTLAILLWSPEEGPFAKLTVNIEDSDSLASESKAFVDTNNCPWAEEFIQENGLGEFTGIYGNSGFCTYPLYEFNIGKLKSL